MEKIHDPKHWPPGCLMKFDNGKHSAVGLVVWNCRGQLGVLWPEHCWDRFCIYPIESLNPAGISRVE